MSVPRKDAIAEAWRRGSLDYKRRPYQKRMRDGFRNARKMFAGVCGRRIGKTYEFCIDACELSVKKPRARTMYAYPTQKQARKVVCATMAQVLDDCPADLRPVFNKVDLTWTFPNGSVIHLSGCDDETAADNLRGDAMDLGIVDEAGFNPVLRYLMDSVLLPQTLTTGGKIVMISTPPKQGTGHPFWGYFNECKASGDSIELPSTIAADYFAPGELEELVRKVGGWDSVAAKREYLAEWITDLEHAVVPEFTTNKEHLVREVSRPSHFNPCVAADFGFSDATVVVFGYYCFERAVVVIEDEVVCHRESALSVGHKVRAKESERGYLDPMRIADAPMQVLADLYEGTGVMFGPAVKTDADAALNTLRRYCQERKLAVHPRCKITIAQLEAAVWNKARTSYERSETHFHFDAVDAVKYFVRHVDQHSNPFPTLAPDVQHHTHWIRPGLSHERPNNVATAFGWR